jgi:hypothetical protein
MAALRAAGKLGPYISGAGGFQLSAAVRMETWPDPRKRKAA